MTILYPDVNKFVRQLIFELYLLSHCFKLKSYLFKRNLSLLLNKVLTSLYINPEYKN